MAPRNSRGKAKGEKKKKEEKGNEILYLNQISNFFNTETIQKHSFIF